MAPLSPRPRVVGGSSGNTHSAKLTGTSSRISLFYANITQWGKKAEDFLGAETSDFVCYVEHRLDSRQLEPVLTKLKSFRRAHFVAAAARVGEHMLSTSGGLAIFPKSHLCCSPPEPELLAHCIPPAEQRCPRWTACILRLKNVSVLLIVVYLRTAEGFSEANSAILQQIFLYVSCFRGLVIVGGDWQFTPDELVVSPWLARLQLSLVVPPVEATCTSGKGRLIDYFVASAALAPYITISVDLGTPFRPHSGIRVSFPARLRALVAPAPRVPRALPQLPVVDGEHELQEDVWSRAVEFADSYVRRRAPVTKILGCTEKIADGLGSDWLKASQQYCAACTRIEVYSAFVSGVDADRVVSYIGRGGFPHASLKPIVPRQALRSRHSCQNCNLWNMVVSLLSWVRKGAVSRQPVMSLRKAILDLHNLSDRIQAAWTRRAAPNCPVHAWLAWIKDLSVDAVVSADPLYVCDRIQVWMSRAEAQLKVAVSAKTSQVRSEFRQWLKEDLAKGASGAHRMVSDRPPTPAVDPWTTQATFDTWAHIWDAGFAPTSSEMSTSSSLSRTRKFGRSLVAPAASLIRTRNFDLRHGASQNFCNSQRSVEDCLSKWSPWKTQLESAFPVCVPVLANARAKCIVDGVSMPPITVDGFRKAARAYPGSKALGLDGWTSLAFRTLPCEVLSMLVASLNTCQSILQWPVQFMINAMTLISKPLGGQRSIAKTPMVYRLWNIVNADDVRRWSDQNCPAYDFASKGRSALFAGAHRCWSNELCRYAGLETASVLWDVEKFFDNIRPQDVLREGVRLGYPLGILIMALSLHTAPRCLLLGGILSQVMLPGKSILAGCFHSVNFARLIMNAPINKVISTCAPPTLRVTTFVDDVAQISLGTRMQVVRSAIYAAIAFCAGMKSLRLSISAKSVVISSSPKLAGLIAKVVAKHAKVMLHCKGAERDLGVLNNPSKKRVRNTALQKARLQKAGKRFSRIAPLARQIRAARALAKTGAVPQATWGAVTLGMAPTAVKALKTQYAAATGIQSPGRCASTAIAICSGPRGDPAVKLVIDQVSLYVELWRADASLRALTVRHWNSVVATVLGRSTSPNWNQVSGPLSATIAVLANQGWDLRSAVCWIDPSGAEWTPNFSQDCSVFIEAVAHFALSKVWTDAASNSWNGRGLQGGIDWTASLSLHRHLFTCARRASTAAGDDEVFDAAVFADEQEEVWAPTSVTWLELFLTGGYWPAARAAQAMNTPDRCTRCRLNVPETELHFLYTCPANASVDDPRVADSQDLVSQAVEGCSDTPCLWLRGLLPAAFVPVNTPAVHTEDIFVIGDFNGWLPGTYYGDGSGGPFSAYPLLRRCGVGIAVVQPNYDYTQQEPNPFRWGAFLALPGLVQTVPRAELMVLVVVVERVSPGMTVIKSDNRWVVDTFGQGKDHCLAAQHSDLWTRIFEVLDRGLVVLEVTWVKGHVESVEVASRYDVVVEDIFGNALADKLADRAADEFQVHGQDALTVRWHYSLVRRIQARAVVLLTTCMQRRSFAINIPRIPRERPLSVTGAALRSQHSFTLLTGVLHCHRCHRHSPANRAGILRWLDTPCAVDVAAVRAITAGTTKPTAVPSSQAVHVGRVQLHPSHTLFVYRGLFFCKSCGYHASTKAQKLVAQCEGPGPLGKGIKRALSLLGGQLPSNMMTWPNDLSARTTGFVELG